VRIETMRRVANVVRGKKDAFADLIARETGKPLWESATEVDAVINKVDISVSAYSERTSQRRLEGALGARVAVRHKPHGVLAVLGPYNFPAHLPNGTSFRRCSPATPSVFKPSRRPGASASSLVERLHEGRGFPEEVVRCVQGGPEIGKAARRPWRNRRPAPSPGSARAGPRSSSPVRGDTAQDPGARNGGNNPLVVWDRRTPIPPRPSRSSRLPQRRPALYRSGGG
jgi:succinylglutamic semialdehyde dehydrogenase